MTNLRTTYLGLELKSPIVASAGPLTGQVDQLAELERHGAAAIVLPSLFEEQIEHETGEIDQLLNDHPDSFGDPASLHTQIVDNGGIDRYLELIEAAKSRVDVPIIASLNATNLGGWLRSARLLQDAGADAIELNVYAVAADPIVSATALESEQYGLVALLAAELNIPLAVKISPFYSSLASFVLDLQEAGAAGVVMFNRFYLPDLDLETLDVTSRIALSTPDDLGLPLRWTGILRDSLTMSIAGSSGVHSGFDVAKLLVAGADVAMTTSALLRNGVAHLSTMHEQLRDWMDEHGYESVTAMRGIARRAAVADPAAYERANYIGNLASFTASFTGGDRRGDQP